MVSPKADHNIIVLLFGIIVKALGASFLSPLALSFPIPPDIFRGIVVIPPLPAFPGPRNR